MLNQSEGNATTTTEEDYESELKSRQSKATIKKIKSFTSLEQISRSPVQCPTNDCQHTVGISSILSHFISNHPHVNVKTIENQSRIILEFSESIFAFNEDTCLGVLMYAGKDEKTRPGKIGLSLQNAFLPDSYKNYVNHLPILIMGCKTNLAALSGSADEVEWLRQKNNSCMDIIVLWMTTTETTKPIYATMSVFNQLLNFSHSCVMKIRNLKASQMPVVFLGRETNYLRLGRADIGILTDNKNNVINMEIIMEESDERD